MEGCLNLQKDIAGMARPLYASFLPTIKCSRCGVEIEISAMGEHLCSSEDEGSAQTYNPRTDHDRIEGSHLRPPGLLPIITELSDPAKGQFKTFTSLEDARQLQKPLVFAQSPSPTPMSSLPFSKPPKDNPTIPGTELPDINSTSSTTTRPSPDLALRQDSPFPLLATGTNLTRQNAPPQLTLKKEPTEDLRALGDLHAPRSAQLPMQLPSAGVDVLKRMNTIAPGPFKAWGREEANETVTVGIDRSTAISNANTELQELLSPKPEQLPQRPPRPDTDDSLAEQLLNSTPDAYNMGFLVQSPSDSNSPQGQVTSLEEFSLNETKNFSSHETVPPLPQFPHANSALWNRRGYSLTESESSNSCPSISEMRTDSSRSSRSPLTSNSSGDMNQNLFMEQGVCTKQRKGSGMIESASVDRASPITEFISDRESSRSIHNGDKASEDTRINTQTQPDSRHACPSGVTKTSPSLWGASNSQQFVDGDQRLSSLRYDPSVSNGRASGPDPEFQRMSNVRKPRVPPKGDCRGCRTPIVGKSIRAADGRLSGRWHRECLICVTCRAPFQTADFYVLNDQPYCAHHYHVLNNSLCHRCKVGIEGKYLETQLLKRYHLECFTCNDCHTPMIKDYFDINGIVYCEADAQRTWQQSKMLTSKRRFPERRTTKLMTMS